MPATTQIDPSKLTEEQKKRLAEVGFDFGDAPVSVVATPQAALTIDDLKNKSSFDWTIDDYKALRADFESSLKPGERMKPEYWPVGARDADNKLVGPPTIKPHAKSPMGAAALNDDSNLILVAAGQITGGSPPTSLGKIYNWGSLTRTNTGIYTITIGSAYGVNTAQAIWTFYYRTVVAGLPCIKVADTSDTVKTFNVFDNNVAVDTAVFGFALWRMPFTA